jgi:hypothetical protein
MFFALAKYYVVCTHTFCSFPFVKCRQNSLIVCITSIRSNNRKQISKYDWLMGNNLGHESIFPSSISCALYWASHPCLLWTVSSITMNLQSTLQHHVLVTKIGTPTNTLMLRVCVCSNCRQKCRLSNTNTHEGMITDTSSSNSSSSGRVNQHPPPHHPLDACYYSVVDGPQLS